MLLIGVILGDCAAVSLMLGEYQRGNRSDKVAVVVFHRRILCDCADTPLTASGGGSGCDGALWASVGSVCDSGGRRTKARLSRRVHPRSGSPSTTRPWVDGAITKSTLSRSRVGCRNWAWIWAKLR